MAPCVFTAFPAMHDTGLDGHDTFHYMLCTRRGRRPGSPCGARHSKIWLASISRLGLKETDPAALRLGVPGSVDKLNIHHVSPVFRLFRRHVAAQGGMMGSSRRDPDSTTVARPDSACHMTRAMGRSGAGRMGSTHGAVDVKLSDGQGAASQGHRQGSFHLDIFRDAGVVDGTTAADQDEVCRRHAHT